MKSAQTVEFLCLALLNQRSISHPAEHFPSAKPPSTLVPAIAPAVPAVNEVNATAATTSFICLTLPRRSTNNHLPSLNVKTHQATDEHPAIASKEPAERNAVFSQNTQ